MRRGTLVFGFILIASSSALAQSPPVDERAAAKPVQAGVPPAQDPVKLSPHMYKVLMENDHVRVLEFRAKAGEKEPLHSHPGMVVHILSDTKVRLTAAGGRPEEPEGKTGDTIWVDPVTHTFEVLGPGDAHELIVEIKSATSVQSPAGLQDAASARDRAIYQADAATWDRLTADDFSVVQVDGRVRTKADRLAELGRQTPGSLPAVHREEEMRLYGNTAMRRVRSGNLRVTETWVNGAKGWQAAAVHVTETADASYEAGIRRAISAYQAALNSADVAGVMATYTPDAVFLPDEAPARDGADAIRAHYRALFKTSALDMRFQPSEVFVSGPWGIVRATITGTSAARVGGAPTRVDSKALFVMRRAADGSWRIARYQFNKNAPAPAGAR